MKAKGTRRDEHREERISMEIIVDAYGPEEQAMGWYYYLGRVNTTQRICDQRKVDKKGEHRIQFVVPREDPAKSLQSAEKPFHFIALFVARPVVFPGLSAITFRRHHRNAAQLTHQLARFIALIGAIHDDIRGR